MAEQKHPESSSLVLRTVVGATNSEEQEILLAWANGLLDIRRNNLPAHRKALASLRLTRESEAVWPFIRLFSRELKRIGWDERSWKARIGVGAAVATVAAVGKAGAGIAALGGAIGVPLWVVLGAGGTFAGLLIDELTKSLAETRTTYTVIEAQKELPENSSGK